MVVADLVGHLGEDIGGRLFQIVDGLPLGSQQGVHLRTVGTLILRGHAGRHFGKHASQILAGEILVGEMQALVVHGRNVVWEQVGHFVAAHIALHREHGVLHEVPGLFHEVAGLDDAGPRASVATGLGAAFLPDGQGARHPLAGEIRCVVLEETRVPVRTGLGQVLAFVDGRPPGIPGRLLIGDAVHIPQRQQPIHGFDADVRIQGDVAVGVEIVGTALADIEFRRSREAGGFDIVRGDCLTGRDEVVPSDEGVHVHAGAFEDVGPVVQHHRRQGVLHPVNLALVAVQGFPIQDQILKIAALAQPIPNVQQAGIGTAQETAEAALFQIRDVRGADAAGLQGDLNLVVHVGVGDLGYVEVEVEVDLGLIVLAHGAEPARVGVDEGPDLQVHRGGGRSVVRGRCGRHTRGEQCPSQGHAGAFEKNASRQMLGHTELSLTSGRNVGRARCTPTFVPTFAFMIQKPKRP